MLTFRHLFGVSAGAVIALGYAGTATAQNLVSLADSNAAREPVFDTATVSAESLDEPLVKTQPSVTDLQAENLEIASESELVRFSDHSQKENNQEIVETRVIELAQSSEQNRLEDYDEPLEPVEDTEELNPSSNPLNFPTNAEEVRVDGVIPITLEQAIQLARQNNQTFKEARLNLNQAEDQLQEALAAEFPTLSLQTDLQRSTSASNEIRASGGGFGATDGVTTDLNATLQLNYNLYTGGQRPAQIRLSESQVRTQELALEQVAEQLRFDVTDAYYGVQQADSQVEIARAAVSDAEQSLRDAELLEEAGLGTRFDVLQAEVQLANEEQNLTRALSQQRIRRRELVEVLGLGQQIEVTAATPPEVAGTWDLSLEESIVRAYQNRSELEQQLEQKEIGEANQNIALANIKPNVSLFTRYNVRDIIDDGSGTGTGTGDGLAIGAQLQWTLYDGGQARARAEQAKEDVAIAENRFDQIRNQIRREVEQAFYNLEANEQNIDTATIAVEQAEESLRLARLRFQAGVGTQTDVINAQSELTRARGNLLTAIIDYNRSLAALQRAVSNLPDGRLFDTP
ncbi:TolC family protein [Dactylococcopsis salina]|uniref:Outer membrane protein n=1 Tax=Dactylococcopsis salina (strain PCC 8305) TaxID=13035 RepID=K9YQW0_DACS8|nr:TolC family protein [Dactylococcopsis salina]AFZ49289.1 outer membrane protein [Dactylococcopsis salina PCC 8305]